MHAKVEKAHGVAADEVETAAVMKQDCGNGMSMSTRIMLPTAGMMCLFFGGGAH